MTRLRRVPEDKFARPRGVDRAAVCTVFRVPPEVAGQRVDVFVKGQLRRTSRTRTQAIVRASAFDGDGKRLKSNDRVHAHMHVLLWRAPWDEVAVPTDIPIVYEDDHLIAVNKPPHLPVHPSARYYRNTLIKLMQAERPNEFLSLGHRLDRETSGLLLITKSPECDRALKRQLERRDGITKTYAAITWGVPKHPKGEPNVYSEFRLERNMELDPTSTTNVKMRISDAADALYAATRFAVRQTRTDARGHTYALVRCDLETGRQHQIRLHLQTLGAPIVGDKLYGPDEMLFARSADGALTDDDRESLELDRHALHAQRLELPHPITGEPLEIEAELPDDLRTFWEDLVRQSARP